MTEEASGRTLLPLLVAASIVVVGLWVGFVAFGADAPVGLAVAAVAIIVSLYAYSALARTPRGADIAFRASLVAIIIALAMLFAFQVTGADFFVVAAPVVGAGAGFAHVVPPLGQTTRTWLRLGLVVAAAAIASWVYGVDHTVYALVAPLLPLPAVLLADRAFDRASEVVAEPPHD